MNISYKKENIHLNQNIDLCKWLLHPEEVKSIQGHLGPKKSNKNNPQISSQIHYYKTGLLTFA